ncbi:unnamed protein product [Tenebrio molitor]|nr:unnamed protein product [Tenebrio molitor]
MCLGAFFNERGGPMKMRISLIHVSNILKLFLKFTTERTIHATEVVKKIALAWNLIIPGLNLMGNCRQIMSSSFRIFLI